MGKINQVGMGKSQKKSLTSVSWVAETKRNEVIYGCVRKPIIEEYPQLRNVIWKSNNATLFEPDLAGYRHLKSSKPNGHPFEREIFNFSLSPEYLEALKNFNMQLSVPIAYPVKLITEKSELVKLVQHLKGIRHLFVDLENHTWRSYRGLTALMQLSDGENVYFVDTLKLHGEMQMFGDIFTDPSVIKIFHASSNDIKWLEKDFSLYIVGLMDTQVMHRVLYSSNNVGYKQLVHESFPGAGLDKAVRNTDFRNRPLHPEQEKYAYLDVYYLPYLYFKMMSEMSYGQLTLAIRECQKVSLLRFTFPSLLVYKPGDSQILKFLKLARDTAARKEDVNPEFLCSVSALEKLAIKKECKLGITPSPLISDRFLKYKDCIVAALKGEDPTPLFITAYRDLGIPFPYRSPLFCFNCEATTHVKRDCPEPKSVGKLKKQLHYQQHPEKKNRQVRRRNDKVKNNPESKRKRNIRNNRRKMQKKLNALFV